NTCRYPRTRWRHLWRFPLRKGLYLSQRCRILLCRKGIPWIVAGLINLKNVHICNGTNMHSMKNLAFIFLIVVGLGGCTGGQIKQELPRLSATDFSAKINETENALILDVRTPDEFAKGHLQNAVNIDWKGSDFDRNVSK